MIEHARADMAWRHCFKFQRSRDVVGSVYFRAV